MSLMKYVRTQVFDRRDRYHPIVLHEDYNESAYWYYQYKTVHYYTANVPPILVEIVENAKYVVRVQLIASQRLEVFNVTSMGGIY